MTTRLSALIVLLLAGGVSGTTAATLRVSLDGAGDFTTIQACADAAKPGDTCVVSAGVYPEHVRTAAGGTGEDARITFLSQGVATMQGFDIRHPFVTVEGFDVTGFAGTYQGLISVYFGGDDCRILQNTLRDGAPNVLGLNFITSGGRAASRCVVQGNTFAGLQGTFLTTGGEDHRFIENTFSRQNSRDLIRLFGANHIFRRNIFWKGTTVAGVGNHPDVVQVFGGEQLRSENHLFEENWIQDLESQFGQMNAGDGVVSKAILYDNIKNITFRRNVIASVSNNANISVPGVQFEHNTFYRMAYRLMGIGYGGSLTRGDASRGVLRHNVFLAGGSRAETVNDGAGFYALTGAVVSKEVIAALVIKDPTQQQPATSGIGSDLAARGYTDPNGRILVRARALTSLAEFELDPAYDAYRTQVFDVLTRTVTLDTLVRGTFSADYNFVAGAASAGFPAKRSSECDGVTDRSFCEPHGINGGNPHLRDPANPLGPDGLPFTLDDGLKPLPTSPLCGAGEGRTDIGAYSCDPAKVFPADVVDTDPSEPSTRTVKQDGSGDFTTIQACANAAEVGETCLVLAGVYPEHPSTVRAGVTFKASGLVTMQGFRVRHPDIRIEGFDITKYAVGLDQAHIRVEPEADRCQIIGNTIRDGIYLSSNGFLFDGPTRTITNPAGGFIAAGFVPGVSIYIGSDINAQILNHDNNKGTAGDPSRFAYETKTVRAVTDTTLTLDAGNTVFTEGPVQSTIYVNSANKDGIWGILFVVSSSRGTVDGCLVRGNTFRNLASRVLWVHGADNLIEGNTFERLNGWRPWTFTGDRNIFRQNIVRDSPRWPGFSLPTSSVGAEGSGTWDMYDSLFVSRAPSFDNVIEGNYFAGVDAQFANVTEAASRGLIIRRNVFVGYELTGAIQRPGTQILNNTFYRTAWRGSQHSFVLAKSSVHGNPVGSIIKNNAFIETGKDSDPTSGWYSITGFDGVPTPGVTADYNFVTGANGSAKTGFTEVHGVNGGDARLRDLANPLGADGVPFTADDGFVPLAGSPLCGAGEGGTDIGAYACAPAPIPEPEPEPEPDPPCVFQPAQFRSLAFEDGALVLTDAAGCTVRVGG